MEDAVRAALKKCSESGKQITCAWVNAIQVNTDDGSQVTGWRVDLRLPFEVEQG